MTSPSPIFTVTASSGHKGLRGFDESNRRNVENWSNTMLTKLRSA
jgi:hypothetical protein